MAVAAPARRSASQPRRPRRAPSRRSRRSAPATVPGPVAQGAAPARQGERRGRRPAAGPQTRPGRVRHKPHSDAAPAGS